MVVNRDSRRGRAESFSSVADSYERGRPEYPREALRWLTGDRPVDVIDLGAGTGKLTRGLLALGHRVTAVEPLEEMLGHLKQVSPDVEVVVGHAEKIPLPAESVDVVTVGQAFHWFDTAAALPEIARVLRAAGRLALVWNTRDDREPWVARLSKLIGSETVESVDAEEPVVDSGLFTPIESAQFTCEQRLDRATLRDLVLSRSYCATRTPAEREQVLTAVEQLYDEVAGPDGVVLPYVTGCFRAAKR
jgi:SAM-dependent methyltransferase